MASVIIESNLQVSMASSPDLHGLSHN
jgi:hypothetical protein